MMRTHYCGSLTVKISQTVTLCGWVHRRRGVISLRDRDGLVQVVIGQIHQKHSLLRIKARCFKITGH